LAILLVVSGHWATHFKYTTYLAIVNLPVFKWGWAGVDLFFVLSGYLIGGQLWRELQKTNTINVSRFIMRRGLRIWPYYFAFVAFCMAFLTDFRWRAKLADGWIQFLPDLTFLSNYIPGAVAGGWSLSTEEQFYIVAPLLLLLTTRWISLNKQWIPLVALLVALPVARAFAIADFAAGVERSPMVIYTPLHTHSDGLVIGMLIAWVGTVAPRFMAHRPLRLNLLWPGVLLLIGAVLYAISQDIFKFEALAFIFGGCVLFALRDNSIFTSFARWHGFYLISRLSFAMYLNHTVLLEVVPLVYDRGYAGFIAGYAVLLGLSMGIACLTFLCIESPFLQLRDRWMTPSRLQQPAVAT
jgi:peptidoglycan/LPS O-acetylase OafA/YrhL